MSHSPLPPGSHVYTYARDSGGDEQERSVERQQAAYTEYAAQHQLIIARHFADKAKPGGSTIGREEFDELIHTLRRANPKEPNAVRGLLLWKLNRFARNVNDSQYYKADLRRRGYTLIFLADNIPDVGDAGIIFESMLEWKAARDRVDLSTDIKAGLKSVITMRQADGTYYGFAPGATPVCFQRQPVQIGTKRNGTPRFVSRLVPDAAKWPLGQLAWELRAGGASYQTIHAQTRLFKTLSGYHTFFSNEIYRGVLNYGPTRLENFVPALCTEEQWHAVQKLREQDKAKSGRRHPRTLGSSFLLSGLVFCAECGAALVGNSVQKWAHYVCNRKRTLTSQCPNSRRIAARTLEASVLNLLSEKVFTVELLGEHIAAELKAQAQAAHTHTELLAARQKELRANAQAIAHLLSVLESGQTSAAITARLKELEQTQVELQGHIAQMQTALTAPLAAPTPAQIAEVVEQFRYVSAHGDVTLRRQFIGHFIHRIECGKISGTVWFSIPLNPSVLHRNPLGLPPKPLAFSIKQP